MRFSAENYDTKNIGNIYSHLTNNSIVKHSSQFDCSVIKENMWDAVSLETYLKTKYNKNVYGEIILPKIKQVIYCTIISALENITQRENTHEIFGIDLMIDSSFNVWLIEVNASPCMEYSTVKQ